MREAQDFKCASCGKAEGSCVGRHGAIPLCVDHDHRTGEVRGLLCTNCNKAAGLLDDLPEKAEQLARYLKSFTSQQK